MSVGDDRGTSRCTVASTPTRFEHSPSALRQQPWPTQVLASPGLALTDFWGLASHPKRRLYDMIP